MGMDVIALAIKVATEGVAEATKQLNSLAEAGA